MNNQPESAPGKNLQANIGLVAALSLVVGMVLGAGAFMKPPAVLAAAGDSTWAMVAWAVGGLFSMAGGLTLCELGVLFPRTGGVYVYLEELYGPRVAYLFGWMLVVIFGPASIGALTGYFSSVFCLLFSVPEAYAPVVGAAVLAFVTLVNSIGVREAGYLQTTATVCKLIPIILLAVFGLWKGDGQVLHVAAGTGEAVPFSVAILATLFAYDGWAQVAAVSGEIRNPAKVLPQAIIGGLAFLIVVYLAINVALLKVVPADKLVLLGHEASSIVAQKLFGLMGGKVVAVGIMISILGGLNGYTMTLSRIVYTMADRGQIFGAPVLRKIDPDSNTPVNAVILLTASSYIYYRMLDADKLTDIAVFAIWIFYLLAFVGVFIARRTHAHLPRSYKVPLYPIVPLIAIGGALYVIYGMIANRFAYALISVGLTLAGLPVYYLMQAREKPALRLPAVKTKYLVAVASLLVLGLLTLSVQVFDTRPQISVAVEPGVYPFAFDKDGKLTGYDIELMDAVAAKAGLKPVYRATTLENMLAAVHGRQADAAISSLSVTAERQKLVAFTRPYIVNGGLALLAAADSPVIGPAGLAGQPVGVRKDSTGEQFARQAGAAVVAFHSDLDLIDAFNRGTLAAVVHDRATLDNLAGRGLITRAVALRQLNREQYAIAYAADNRALGDKLDKALAALQKSGDLDALYEKWFTAPGK